jgi:hypothetical protein
MLVFNCKIIITNKKQKTKNMKFKVGTKEYEIADSLLTQAITDKTGVLDLAVDDIARTKDEDNRFVENMKKEARKEGVEIAIKKTRDTMGLTFEGKTIDNLVTAVTEKVKAESGEGETEKVTKLESRVREKDVALQTALSRATEAENKAKNLQSSYKIDRALDSFIPKNTVLPAEDVKTILRAKLKFVENEAGTIEVSDANGVVIKNTATSDALPVKDVIENFFRDNTHYIKEVQGGGGGDDSAKGGKDGKMTIEKFNEDMKTKGHQINSPEYSTEMNKAIAAKTLDLD